MKLPEANLEAPAVVSNFTYIRAGELNIPTSGRL